MTDTRTPLSDPLLLQAIRAGDRRAFSQLVERHHAMFFRIAYRIVLNHADAEDIVQDCFVTLWRRPHLWKPEKGAKFTTWFTRIVINRALNLQTRRPSHDSQALETLKDERADAEDVSLQKEQAHWLENELAKLPKTQRMALNLCFFETYSNQEAADMMGCSLSSVKSLLSRARQTLRARYKSWDEQQERLYEHARH